MLNICNLHKGFKEKSVLKNVNLDIKKGSIFGLVGINGSGKSTLLRCIAGVYEPDLGNVLFNGCNTFNEPKIKQDIILASDDAYFPINSTIQSLKMYYKSFYNLNEERYQKYLKMFDLDENQQIANFSKGMKRQANLLFALAIKPKLILLDECFDGLDPLVRLTFKKALIDLIEDDDTIVIISSHNLKELEDICDSFGILQDGKIDTYGDLIKTKENVIKFQVAFKAEVNKEEFNKFHILSYKQEGRVITFVVKDDVDEVRKFIQTKKPILVDEIPVSFEELFIYEVESRGLLNE